MGMVYLFVAIVFEVIATSALKVSDGMTRFWPGVVTVVGYAICFAVFAQALRTIDLGVAYAIWSGVGIVLLVLIGWVVYGEALDLAGWAGVGLILAGVVVLNVFSDARLH